MKYKFLLYIFLCISLVSVTYALDNNIVVEAWNFGDDANASINSANDGTVTGATHLTSSICPITPYGCYDFDGSGDGINFGNDASIRDTFETWSMSMWIRNDVDTSKDFFWQGSGASSFNWKLRYGAGGDNLLFYFSNTANYVGTNTLSLNTWYHFVVVYNGSESSNARKTRVYINGVNDTQYTDGTIPSSMSASVYDTELDASISWNGAIDNLVFWNDTLTDTEILELYANGTDYPYSAPASNISYHRVKIINNWNGSNMEGVSVNLSNGVGNLTQSDGIAYFSNYTGNLSFNATFSNFFNVTGLAIENSTVTYNMSQSEINFNCFEKITNNTLTCVNGTIYPNAEDYNFSIDVNNYYRITQEETITALDNKTINVTGFANSWLNISAKDQTDDSAILNFTLIYTDIDNGFTETLAVNGTNINNTLIEGRNYSVEINALGYEYKTQNFTNFTSQDYLFELYTSNSVLINIFKESDGTRIYDNITIRFTDADSNITEYITNTSIQYVDNLSIGNYTIAFISSNYSTRTYEIAVGNNTFQRLNAYLVDDGLGSTVFEFQNVNTGATLEGVTLTIEKIINATWTVVEVLNSDVTGRTSFDYIDDDTYRFIASLSGYTTKSWTLDPILFSSYTIKLDPTITQIDESDYSGINIYYSPEIYYNDLNNTVSFTFVSPNGEFLSYGFNVTYKGAFNSSSGSNAYGGNIVSNIEINGSEEGDLVVVEYYYHLSDGDSKGYIKTFIIDGASAYDGTWLKNLRNKWGLGIFERVLIVVGLVLLVMGAGAYYGGAIAGGVLGLFLFGLFAYTTFIPLWSVIISMITLFIILTWRSSL